MSEELLYDGITMQRAAYGLCAALEGGSTSWIMSVRNVLPSAWTFDDELNEESDGDHWRHEIPFNPGGALIIQPDEDDEVYRLDLEAIKRGLAVMHEKYPHHFHDLKDENEDAITGDIFLQCCLFGEEVYG